MKYHIGIFVLPDILVIIFMVITVASCVFRKSKGVDITVSACCTEIPQKDQQDPLYRPTGNAVQPHQLFTTQTSHRPSPVAPSHSLPFI